MTDAASHRPGRGPDFLVIGGQKCGTTSVHSYLRGYDCFHFPERKELHFFDDWHRSQQPEAYNSYIANFAGARDDQLSGEATPDYLARRFAPSRIAERLPDVRLVAILRNPVDRAYSAYWHARRVGKIPRRMAFEESIERDSRNAGAPWTDTVGGGCYFTHLERYLRYFDREQLFVTTFDELLEQPGETMADLVAFLVGNRVTLPDPGDDGLPYANRGASSRAPRLSSVILRRAASGGLVHRTTSRLLLSYDDPPPMGSETRDRLLALYRPWNDRLAELLGRSLDAWTR
jgi:hypothetical protein